MGLKMGISWVALCFVVLEILRLFFLFSLKESQEGARTEGKGKIVTTCVVVVGSIYCRPFCLLPSKSYLRF
jgi:hypothetical protein